MIRSIVLDDKLDNKVDDIVNGMVNVVVVEVVEGDAEWSRQLTKGVCCCFNFFFSYLLQYKIVLKPAHTKCASHEPDHPGAAHRAPDSGCPGFQGAQHVAPDHNNWSSHFT